MKKFTLLFGLLFITILSFGQMIHGVGWVSWANEPDYANTPFDNLEITVNKAPSTWAPVASVVDFDATWDLLGDANNVANPTAIAGGDLFDLNGDATFGASWKGIHDGDNFYVLLKYSDINGLTDADGMSFEITAQPTSPVRHEATFLAASDSTAANTFSETDLVINYQNQAYARAVELGGGKAAFKNGFVNEYAASVGIVKNAWQDYFLAGWGANEAGLDALLDADHFWDKTDGVIRAVMVMSLNGALSYPTDPADLAGDRTALVVGETFAFDVKSNALIGEEKTEYFWSADANNGYASNYYSGYVTLSDETIGEEAPAPFKVHGVGWVSWANEPDYANTPFDNLEITVNKAPSTWAPVASVVDFDATWDLLGDANNVANPTAIAGGDLFDLNGDATFGASWKGIHDGDNFYVLLKYSDINGLTDADGMSFEITAQPTSPVRHEATFLAASDSTAANTFSETDLVINYQNQAYARAVELGGGKAAFKNGFVNEYAASVGIVKNAWQDYFLAGWGANEAGLDALLDADHFWDKTDGVIRAVMVMSLNGALSYPTDPADLAGDRTALVVGETFAFDVKSNALIGEEKTEYFWSADANNGYASNYYSGYVTLSGVITSSSQILVQKESQVYLANNMLYVRNSKPVNLEIYNILGVRLKVAQNVSKLSMQEFHSGIYLVRVNSGRTAVKVVKY